MGTLNISFRCVENVQKEFENAMVCYANNLYEDTIVVSKAFDGKGSSSTFARAAHKLGTGNTTREYLLQQIRKQLKKKGLPKKIYNAKIVITYMWDEQ